MKAHMRMAATLAVVVPLFVWIGVAPQAHAQKGKKAGGADKAAKQADRAAKKEERQQAREERAAQKEERKAGKGKKADRADGNGENREGGGERQAKKEEREAKKEERQAKRNERQAARGDAAQSGDAGGDAAKKSRRANAASQPGADNLSEGDDPFEKQGRKRNRKAAAAAGTTPGQESPGEQPAAKGRRAKANAAAAGTDGAATPATGAGTESTSTPTQTPVNASPSSVRTSVPAPSAGASSLSAPSASTGASGGDVPPSATGGEQPASEPAAAGTGGNKGSADQKFMKAAKHDLSMAVAALKRATADKGTYRDRAIELTQQAVSEIDKGMAYDQQNPHDRQRERPGKQSRSEQNLWGDGVESVPAFGARFVATSWSGQKPSRQPNMLIAKQHLQSALSNLDKATADKGGYRANAVRLVHEAIREVEQGIAYDNTH